MSNCRRLSRCKAAELRKSGTVLLWLVMICLLPTLGGAVSHVIDAANDLPYTTTGPHDTVRVTVNGIISGATGTSITLAHDHCRLLLNGNTLYVGQTAVNGFNRGILISGDSCGIENGTLEQHSTSTNDSLQVVVVNGGVRRFTMTDVSVHPRGYSSGGIYSSSSSEVKISGGNWTSYVSDYDSREYQWTAPIYLADEGAGTTRTEGQQYRQWVSHVTIDSCPHAGIVMNGGTLWCDSNFVRVDARNHWTYPSGDIFRGTANAYAICIDRIGANCRVIGNTIRSGKNHRGGRGIALDGQAGYLTHRAIEVAYNDDSTHAGPDAAYGGEYQGVGVRIRDTGTDSLYFHHNTIVVVSDTANATAHTGPGCIAIWLSDAGRLWRFENNTIKAVGVAPFGARGAGSSYGGSFARAIAFDEMHITDSTVWRNNLIESNVIPISFGEVNTENIAGENCYFYNDTINRLTPSYQDEWGNNGAIAMSLGGGDCEDNYMTDVVFPADSTVFWDMNGPGEITMRRLFKITVLGNDGVPFEGARVRVRNAYGRNVVVGTTGLDGTVNDFEAAVKYNHVGIGSDSSYSPFTISAVFGVDSVALTETNVGLRTNLNDTLRLLNTGGTGELDTIPPRAVGDLSASPAALTGHLTFGWTSTGDDDDVGTASFDSIRYSTAPINDGNWTFATVYPRTSAPQVSGTPDQVDIAESTPVSGQFYYIGIRAYDNLRNASPLAVTSGFARGILRPQISTDTTVVDEGAQQVTFFASVVPSYLEHNYEFQLDSDINFGSPTTVTDTDPGAYAEATFPLPAEGETVMLRCRAVALDQSETSPWSPTRAFSASGGYVNGPPSTPVAYSPVADDIVTSLRPTLVVNNSVDPDMDALTYEFAVLNAAGSSTLASSSLVAQASPRTTWTIPGGVLQDTTDYMWRARSFDGEAYSAWMNPVPFSVYVLSTGEMPAAAIVHAYPNPVRFASGELATFVLPDEPVDLTIITISGNVVLFRSDLSGQWQWDGANQSGSRVAPGVYPWFLSDDQGHGKLVVKP